MLSLENSLQAFFFDELSRINKKSSQPLSQEMVYYSSLVMDRFGLSEVFFDSAEGKVKEKVLGLKLLKSTSLQKSKKKRELQDIAETSLMICGLFYDSINRKILDLSYYESLGRSSYQGLNLLVPEFYSVPEFYKSFSEHFSMVSRLMSVLSKDFFSDLEGSSFILKELKVS